MSDDDSSPAPGYIELGKPARWMSAGASLIALASTTAYIVWPRSAVVVAPQCAGGTDCGVVVSAVPEAAVLIALITVCAAFALTAATGIVYTFTFGGGSVAPAAAKQVPKPPARSEPVTPEVPQDATAQDPDRLALARWNELPVKLQGAAARLAEDEWGMELTDLQLATKEVRRLPPPARNSPYWATFAVPGKGDLTVRLYTGGRAGGTHARTE